MISLKLNDCRSETLTRRGGKGHISNWTYYYFFALQRANWDVLFYILAASNYINIRLVRISSLKVKMYICQLENTKMFWDVYTSGGKSSDRYTQHTAMYIYVSYIFISLNGKIIINTSFRVLLLCRVIHFSATIFVSIFLPQQKMKTEIRKFYLRKI